jgi:hypothetical protein
MAPLQESQIYLEEHGFPSGPRDFAFGRLDAEGQLQLVHPLELLALDRAVEVINQLGQQDPAQALTLALGRLLVPCLQYRGSGRHLVVEPWSEEDRRGASLPVDSRTPLAKDLAAVQARDEELVTTGQLPPSGSLAKLFWETQTELPVLPEQFDDADLGRFAKALYFFLVPAGEGTEELRAADIVTKVRRAKAAKFAALGLDLPPRKRLQLFKKLLAVAVRWASQVTGEVARRVVIHYLKHHQAMQDRTSLSADEQAMLDLRYGASPDLGNINVGFLFGCGPLLADLVNQLYQSYLYGKPEAERDAIREELRRFLFVLGKFQQCRKAARADERQELRQRKADRQPGRRRKQAQDEADTKARAPSHRLELTQELERLRQLLPKLKPRDAARLRALIDCHGDRAAAAVLLGVTHHAFSQKLRQTTFPNVRRLAQRLYGHQSEEEDDHA